MALHQSNHAKGNIPIPYPSTGGEVVAHRATFVVPTSIAEGDIVELACIPPGCRPIDVIFDSDKLDDGGAAAIVWDVGMLSGEWGDEDEDRALADTPEFFDGSDLSQAGGSARASGKAAFRVPMSAKARGIGAKLVTDAATAAGGTIGITVLYTAE